MKIKLKKSDKIKILYKLFFSLLIIGFILTTWIMNLTNLNHNQQNYMNKHNGKGSYFLIDGYTYTSNFFSYFTIQSNLLCVIFMFLAAIFHSKEDKIWFLKNKVGLMIAIYISITFLIFNTMLLPLVIVQNLFTTPIEWINTMIEHVICPISFVCYYLFLFNKEKRIDKKNLYIKQIPITIIYPLAWLIINVIKNVLISSTVKNSTALKTFLDPNQKYTQYFFMNFVGKTFGVPNAAWFFVAFIVILSIIFVLSFLYNKYAFLQKNVKN